MRNQEAARYARWAAMAAGLIALGVAGVYIERTFRAIRARHAAPPAVPAAVQRQSTEISFSKAVQGRTLFTVHASRSTQYRDQGRYELEDVRITIFGREGNRNDSIDTRQCSYEPKTGAVRCQGDVTIEIRGANPASGRPLEKSLEVKTHNLSFDRETGEASTPEPVEFRFPQGQGHGVGISYSTSDSIVRITRAVEFDLSPSERTGGLPVTATGSGLEIRRNDRAVVLAGPAVVRQGVRELSAARFSVALDENFHARHAVAEGHPVIRSTEGRGTFQVLADKFEGFINEAGWVERIVADGKVEGTRQAAAGVDRFSTEHVELAMLPQHNLVREITASGGVVAQSQQSSGSNILKTDSLRIKFGPGGRADQQAIESAETLAPATIETRTSEETTSLHATQFVAHLASNGRLDNLLGHYGVEVRRQIPHRAPEVSSASELAATFAGNSEWETLDETGSVHFRQADRQATAAHARIVHATGVATLDGSPVLSDSMTRTTATNVSINQQSGEIRATGDVVSTSMAAARDNAVSFGSGAAHLFAETLSGSTASGHVVYAGHARLWQGESVLDADQIELWRDEKKVQAKGNVVAVFPQSSDQLGKSSTKSSGTPSAPILWQLRAPLLTYFSDQDKARLEGGVVANSQQGSLESSTLDVFLSPAGGRSAEGATSAGLANVDGSRQLSRALAQGSVVIHQGDRRGTADQAEYTAADGRFVLTGGPPTLTDASGNTTSGHSLTFFVAGDTILIDSQEGSRTLTKHRIEK